MELLPASDSWVIQALLFQRWTAFVEDVFLITFAAHFAASAGFRASVWVRLGPCGRLRAGCAGLAMCRPAFGKKISPVRCFSGR